MNGLARFREELENAIVTNKGNYSYFYMSITEQYPPLSAEVIEDCAKALLSKMKHVDADVIMTAEAMGISIATAVSLILRKPLVIGTTRVKGVPNEFEAWYQCGYKMDCLNFSPVEKGANVLVIDDIISTGATCLAMIQAAKHFEANVLDVGVVVNKLNYSGAEIIRQHGYDPKSVFDVRVDGSKVIVEN